jgi:hypothetical protein
MPADSEVAGLDGAGLLGFWLPSVEGLVSVHTCYPPGVAAHGARLRGRTPPGSRVAADLAITDRAIYDWLRHEPIYASQPPCLTRVEESELSAAEIRDPEPRTRGGAPQEP